MVRLLNATQPSLLVALTILTAACASAPAARGPSRADPLPLGSAVVQAEVPMKNVDGNTVTLASIKGERGTMVVFTCNHCPWSKAWESRITELGNRYAAKGIGAVAINPNDPEAFPEDSFYEMRERAEAAGMTFPYVVDEGGAVARAFGATKTPEVFLFDASGKLVYYGAVDDNANDASKVDNRFLEDALEAVVNGRAVSKAWTKALGCTIKVRS